MIIWNGFRMTLVNYHHICYEIPYSYLSMYFFILIDNIKNTILINNVKNINTNYKIF